MKNVIGIIREGRSKKGEKRVAVSPKHAAEIINWNTKLIVQPRKHPNTDEIKRIFKDADYKKPGALIQEDLSPANVIFGLKEIHPDRILPDKTYLLFSHTHKGQKKNRKMLKKFVDQRAIVIDYELIADDKNERLITAFTYNAGYAGMVDTLWTLGIRRKQDGIKNPFEKIPQAIEGEELEKVTKVLHSVSKDIEKNGTTIKRPPLICCFLGKGKTAKGARRIFDLLPHKDIRIETLPEVYANGSRNQLYALQIDIEKIYRLKDESKVDSDEWNKKSVREKQKFYFENPDEFESNLDKVLPYITILMNCIFWSPEFPRTVTKELMTEIYRGYKTLEVIGDITCDPNGSIEFSKETWIDNPVYIYNPLTGESTDGFEGDGIAVMAITNLPCEFSADASREFGDDLFPFLERIVKADYSGEFDSSKLPDEIKRAVIMWKGKFTKQFEYMKEYL